MGTKVRQNTLLLGEDDDDQTHHGMQYTIFFIEIVYKWTITFTRSRSQSTMKTRLLSLKRLHPLPICTEISSSLCKTIQSSTVHNHVILSIDKFIT